VEDIVGIKLQSFEHIKTAPNLLGSPYFRFIYALKASETKIQYPKRLEVFLDYLKLQGPQSKPFLILYELRIISFKADFQFSLSCTLDFKVFCTSSSNSSSGINL
jgi:hypothetical protein